MGTGWAIGGVDDGIGRPRLATGDVPSDWPSLSPRSRASRCCSFLLRRSIDIGSPGFTWASAPDVNHSGHQNLHLWPNLQSPLRNHWQTSFLPPTVVRDYTEQTHHHGRMGTPSPQCTRQLCRTCTGRGSVPLRLAATPRYSLLSPFSPLLLDSADAPPPPPRTSLFSNPPTVRSGPRRAPSFSTLMPRERQLVSSTLALYPLSLMDRPVRRNDADDGDPPPPTAVALLRAGIALAVAVSSDMARWR